MAIPQNKSELKEQIQIHYQKLALDLERVPIGISREIGIPGNVKGTAVSPSDVVAYLVGWGELVLKWIDGKEKGLDVDFPETGFKWTELGALAQSFHQKYEQHSYNELLELLEQNTLEILSIIDGYSQEELYDTPWYDKWSMGRMIQLNTSSPFKSNRTKIRKFLREREL